MNPRFHARRLTGSRRWRVAPALLLLLVSPFAGGCDVANQTEDVRMTPNEVANASQERQSVTIELGKRMQDTPGGLEVELRQYGVGDVIVLRGTATVTVLTYEGRRFSAPADLIKVFLNKGGSVTTVSTWSLPKPMPWVEANAWFKDWLKKNEIQPGENLRKKIEIWSNNDIPGNELPGNWPRQDLSGTDLTRTSALSVRWKPHPVRDWILVLGIGLTAEEMGKLREREAASDVADQADKDRPEDAFDKFQQWDETHGDIDVQKLLNDEYEY